MSLILDALNRSRESDQEIPGLATRHGSLAADAGRGWLHWGLGAGLVLALAVIAWLLLRGDGVPPPTVVQPENAPAAPGPAAAAPAESRPALRPEQAPVAPQPAPEAAQQPRPSAPASVAPQPAAPASADVAALYEKPEPAPAAAAPVAEPVPAEVEAETVPAQPEPAPAEPEPTVEEQPVDIESLVTRAEEELANARLAEHPAPFLASLSQQTKDSIPTILYQRHDYSGRPGESSVVLNSKTLRPGGKAASGVRVDEILPDSVVLTYRGTQFRLRALNSWVNL